MGFMGQSTKVVGKFLLLCREKDLILLFILYVTCGLELKKNRNFFKELIFE